MPHGSHWPAPNTPNNDAPSFDRPRVNLCERIVVVAQQFLPSAFGGVCALRRKRMSRLIAASGTSF